MLGSRIQAGHAGMVTAQSARAQPPGPSHERQDCAGIRHWKFSCSDGEEVLLTGEELAHCLSLVEGATHSRFAAVSTTVNGIINQEELQCFQFFCLCCIAPSLRRDP